MAQRLFDKLTLEIQRFQNKEFLKGAMAVAALAARADGEVSLARRYRVDAIISRLTELHIYDPPKAIEIFDEFVRAIDADPITAHAILHAKVQRFAGKPKRARTLMRLAHAVITSDGTPTHREWREFTWICGRLNLDPAVAAADLTQEVSVA
jgi:tellurite resistance protein